MLMGTFAGSVLWFTMMILHKKSTFLMKVDDTLAVFHTHAVAGILTGLLATPELCAPDCPIPNMRGRHCQLGKQLGGALFITVWNLIVTSAILLCIGLFIPLRMSDDQLKIGDDAAHGEEAYALWVWGDGEKFDVTRPETTRTGGAGSAGREDTMEQRLTNMGARGVTIQL
uniref:Ammonium transporter AmtB-like domain-containing protein n=1 Tax=Oryza barthii TaxID=65489 RepID=A0A0D3G6Q0_9ORYZ